MKTIKILILLLMSLTAHGQVGIGTTDPKETLHVAGTFRVDDLPSMENTDRVIVADSVGKLGYKLLDIDGVSFENGISIATDNLLYTPPTNFLDQRFDIDLDLELTVAVAPNTTSIITVEYSVPMGAMNCLHPTMEMLTYIGATFYRDGVIIREANRKIQLDPRPSARIFGNPSTLCSMGFVACSYTETVVNTGNTPIIIHYEVMGYLEQHWVSVRIPYIYRRWSPIPSGNFGWGHAFIKYQKITL